VLCNIGIGCMIGRGFVVLLLNMPLFQVVVLCHFGSGSLQVVTL
jgi:hypothetical protein